MHQEENKKVRLLLVRPGGPEAAVARSRADSSTAHRLVELRDAGAGFETGDASLAPDAVLFVAAGADQAAGTSPPTTQPASLCPFAERPPAGLQVKPGTMAIASSGYTTSNIMADYRDSAFLALVPKPYRIKEMSTALHRVLQA
jgi:hypothetical protein